jgi:hypothetical protein
MENEQHETKQQAIAMRMGMNSEGKDFSNWIKE